MWYWRYFFWKPTVPLFSWYDQVGLMVAELPSPLRIQGEFMLQGVQDLNFLTASFHKNPSVCMYCGVSPKQGDSLYTILFFSTIPCYPTWFYSILFYPDTPRYPVLSMYALLFYVMLSALPSDVICYSHVILVRFLFIYLSTSYICQPQENCFIGCKKAWNDRLLIVWKRWPM